MRLRRAEVVCFTWYKKQEPTSLGLFNFKSYLISFGVKRKVNLEGSGVPRTGENKETFCGYDIFRKVNPTDLQNILRMAL